MTKIAPPYFDELNTYYKSYWKYLKDDDILKALIDQGQSDFAFLASLEKGEENYAYAVGKWMLKEVIGHLIDAERIFSSRALVFARNDKTSLPPFDEDSYIFQSNYRERTLRDITEEWKTVRSATISLFASMNDEIADRKGKANGVDMNARIILYFILVHGRHHMQVIKERYLSTAFYK